MTRLDYLSMTNRQAAAAFDEYVAERPGALGRLRGELAVEGMDPEALLDGTPASLTPLWRWLAARISAVEDRDAPTDPDAPHPSSWPTWARYGAMRACTPDVVVTLLDGFVSYVEEVIARGAPTAVRAICTHPVKRFHIRNQPTLTSPTTDAWISVPTMVRATAGGLRKHRQPVIETQFTDYALRAIAELELVDAREALPTEPEPVLELTLKDGELDVALRDDLAHEHSRLVDQMVEELGAQPGIASAHREDREVLLVRAPDWSVSDLERWLTDWIGRHVRGLQLPR